MIRPFLDSPLTVRRRWYRVPDDTPLLGMPTAFISDRWEPFPYLPRDVGEVYPSDPTYTRIVAPPGMTFDHVCGTAEQFAEGAKFDPDFNSHPDEYWIPRCCGRVVPPGQGVMELGGSCGDVFTGIDPAEGGIEIGGEIGDVAFQVDPTEGGVQLGGAAGESREYDDPTEGGVQLGGAAGDVVDGIDPTAGGLLVGGSAGDSEHTTDPTAGGLVFGGAAGDSEHTTDPTSGGLVFGGAAGDSEHTTDPTSGGLLVGGAAGDSEHTTDPTAGGVVFGGSAGDDYLDITTIPGYVYGQVVNAGTTTTVSATPVDSGTPMSITFTLGAGADVWIEGICTGFTGAGANGGAIWADVNGTDTSMATFYSNNDPQSCAVAGAIKVSLAAGTHTIKLQFSATAGTANFTNKSLRVSRAH